MDVKQKFNTKNTAVKRIMQEAQELERDRGTDYTAAPLDDNIFEWHFTIRGPPDTEFAGGIYHGRILLPPEYPFKPPSIILLTPNGRFEVGKKICLSISNYHPEYWQPSWSIRTVIVALIGFMPSKPEGAVGSLDYTPEERRALASKSQAWACDRCGSLACLLAPSSSSKKPPEEAPAVQVPEPAQTNVDPVPNSVNSIDEQKEGDRSLPESVPTKNNVTTSSMPEAVASILPSPTDNALEQPATVSAPANVPSAISSSSSSSVVVSSSSSSPPSIAAGASSSHSAISQKAPSEPDHLLYVAIAIGILIVALLVRKFALIASLGPDVPL